MTTTKPERQPNPASETAPSSAPISRAIPRASTDPTTDYARAVSAGQIVTGKLVRLACERHLRDLEHGHKRGLRFDRDAAQYAIAFFGFLRHSKGEFARKRFGLALWQKFIVGSVFGWKRADGTRRFRTAYTEVARKNGKSSLLAGVGLFLLVADGEEGAEIYAAATKRDQARIIFGEAQRMVRKSAPLLELVDIFKLNLSVSSTESKFEPLSSDDRTLDGLNPSGVLVDELHKHKTRALLDVLDTALGARRQPVLWIITTAGDEDPESVYAQEHADAQQVLEGMREDDTLFAFIATIDDRDDPFDPACWPKANPNIGISVHIDDLRRQADKAKRSPSSKNSFLRLRLNVRTSAIKHGIAPETWKACGAPVDATTLKGRRCRGGLDLSGKNDLTALVLTFVPEDPGGKVDVLPFFWTPEHELQAKEARDHAPYTRWRTDGFLETTPAKTIDYDFVAAKLGALGALYAIEAIAFDRWRIKDFLAACERVGVAAWIDEGKENEPPGTGIRLVPHGQGFKDMGPSVEALDDDLIEGRLRHGMHPVLTWNAASVAFQMDPAGAKKPAKNKSTGRIDGITALAMARGLAKAQTKPPQKSYLELQELVVL